MAQLKLHFLAVCMSVLLFRPNAFQIQFSLADTYPSASLSQTVSVCLSDM